MSLAETCRPSISLSIRWLSAKITYLMNDEVTFNILTIILLILANAFFVAAEYALVRVRRTKIEKMIGEGVRAAVVVRQSLEQMDCLFLGEGRDRRLVNKQRIAAGPAEPQACCQNNLRTMSATQKCR